MRLGNYLCRLKPDSLAHQAYGKDEVLERHRHRFEVNNEMIPALEAAGMRFSGFYPEKSLVEIIEVVDHPWFLACQFHPEFKTRPNRPHPLFRDFIKAAVEYRGQRKADGQPAVELLAQK